MTELSMANAIPCPACGGVTKPLYQTDFEGQPWFHQCPADGYCFIWPEPGLDELRRLYAEDYSANDYWLNKNRDSASDYYRKISTSLPTGPFRFLEIGGAFGFLSRMVTEKTQANVLLIEAGETATRYAREQLGVESHRGMLDDFQPTEGYDVIFAAHVIEHVVPLDSFLRSCARLLAPNGNLIFLTPNARAWKFRLLGRNWAWSAPEQHTRFLSEASARRLFAKAGLEVIQTRATVPARVNYPYTVARCLSLLFTRLWGRASGPSEVASKAPGGAENNAAPSRLARLRPLGRPLVWLEYFGLSVVDRVSGGRADELLIVARRE